MAPKPQTVERLVGLFILMPLVLLIVLVASLAQERGWFSSWLTIRAPFPVGTIIPIGAKVTFGGAEIGRVRTITTDENGHTIAHLHVRQRLAKQVRLDSKGSLVRPNFIGDPVVNISFGSPRSPRAQDNDIIAMKVPSGNEPEDVTPEFLRRLLTGLLRLTEKTNVMLDQFNQPNSPLQRIMANSDRLLTDLVAAEQAVIALLQDEKALQKALDDRLATTMTHLNRTLHDKGTGFPISHEGDLEMRLNARLQGQIDELMAMAKKMEKLLDTTMTTDNTISLLLRTPEFYNRTLDLLADVKAMVAETREIMGHLKEAAPDVSALLTSGRAMLDRGNRLLKQLETNPFLGGRPTAPRAGPPVDVEQRFNRYEGEPPEPKAAPSEVKK